MKGSSLGPYRLDRELGSGGMGKVWAAVVEGRAPGLDAATGDRVHLVEAKRLLDDLLAKNPPETHDAMRTRVRVNREILAACAAEGTG